MTDNEREERIRMQACHARIGDNLGRIGQRIAEYQDEIQKTHDHMREARRGMDHINKIAMRQSIDQMLRSSDFLRAAGEAEETEEVTVFRALRFRARKG